MEAKSVKGDESNFDLYELYCAALTQWKTVGLLVDRGCTDHTVTKINAFLDFAATQRVVRNPNGGATRVMDRGFVKTSKPTNRTEFLSVSAWKDWGHSINFEKRNSWMELQKRSRLKLTQQKSSFYLPCSILEFKMSSNSVKLDRARKWHRRLGHLIQADLVGNAQETVGELYELCKICAF